MGTYLTNSDELDAIVRLRRRDVTALLRERLESAGGLHPRTAQILDEVDGYFEEQKFVFSYLEDYLSEAMPEVEPEPEAEPEVEVQPEPEPEPVEEPAEVILPLQDDEDASLVILENDVPEVRLNEDDNEPATQGTPTELPEEEPEAEEGNHLQVQEIDVLTPEDRARRVSQRGLIREVRQFDKVHRVEKKY